MSNQSNEIESFSCYDSLANESTSSPFHKELSAVDRYALIRETQDKETSGFLPQVQLTAANDSTVPIDVKFTGSIADWFAKPSDLLVVNADAGQPDLDKNLESFHGLLDLMDYFSDFDKDKSDSITLGELESVHVNLTKGAKYGREHFKSLLTKGRDNLTREDLKEPLVKALVNCIKTGLDKKGELPLSVKEALALYISDDPNLDPQMLMNKINKHLKGTGNKIKIDRTKTLGQEHRDVSIMTVTLDSNTGSEKFSYAGADATTGFYWKNARQMSRGDNLTYVLLDNKSVEFATTLSSLKNATYLAERFDSDNNHILTQAELKGKKVDEEYQPALEFLHKHFAEIATESELTVNLVDLKTISEKRPDLKEDLEFLAKIFDKPSVTWDTIEKCLKDCYERQESPPIPIFQHKRRPQPKESEPEKVQRQQTEKKLFEESQVRFKSILMNKDALIEITGGNQPGITPKRLREMTVDLVGAAIKERVTEHSLNLPGALKLALSREIRLVRSDRNGRREQSALEALEDRLNEALEGSDYKVKITGSPAKEGRHGQDTVKETTIEIYDEKNPERKNTFWYTFDEIRSGEPEKIENQLFRA